MTISAARAKQKQRLRHCEAADCDEAGEYKAPRSREQLREYHYFCLKHVREYNLRWNYFSGMSDPEVADYLKNDITGHRPTRAMSGEGKTGGKPASDNLLFSAFFDSFDRGLYFEETFVKPDPSRKTAPTVSLYPAAVRDACSILGVACPPERGAIKKAYKVLVKELHPDTAEDHTPEKEARFRLVVQAYRDLLKAFKI